MDPMALLDMERRTGVAHTEIDDFSKRMDMIAEAMEQIKSGTFDPAACKIPGYKTPEQEEAEAKERAGMEEERRRKEEERRRKAKEEEREQWWRRAKLRFAIERGEEEEEEGKREGDTKGQDGATRWANRVLAAYKARDANDYSVWENWVPDDPATVEDKAAREAALEKLRNDAFEKNNPEFCQQVKEDLEKRQQSQRERENQAEKLKLQGNRYYKRREYQQAIAQYMLALETCPFNVAVLTNIAQCYLRQEALDDSVEFSTRALYVDPNHVKALSRRAAVWHRQKKWKEAAQDMERAWRLEPENEDVVEQHSIVVGDYEDAMKQNELESQMKIPRNDELRFMSELLSKIDEQEKQLAAKHEANDGSEPTPRTVSEAWMAYDLMPPLLEKNWDARDLLRTTGELQKLSQRLLTVLDRLPELLDNWTKAKENGDGATMVLHVEETTVAAMISVLAAAVTASARNQVVLFRDVPLRKAMLAVLEGTSVSLQTLPTELLEKMLRFFEEVIEAKSWKRAIISSPVAIWSLLATVATPVYTSQSSAHVESRTRAVLSASSIVFTISSDDSVGIKALVDASSPSSVEAIADALALHRRSAPTLSNILGVLTNLSTDLAVRTCLEPDAAAALRSRLVRSLVVLSSHFTRSSLSVHKRRVFRVCAERALAALLNFTFQADSKSRRELLQHNVTNAVLAVLDFVTGDNLLELMVVVSRSVSLLCRLHGVEGASVQKELSSNRTLDALHQICQLSLPAFASTAAEATSSDLWQAHAQIWCHVGWCVALPDVGDHVRVYLRQKQVLPAMLETLSLVNAQRLYRRSSSESPGGPERVAGNVVKVLIAMLPRTTPDESERKFWARQAHLKTLVDALQALPDGLARKNVAILLAKLCQGCGDDVKDKVRELRGIEMLLTISKSLSSSPSTTVAKAKAF